MKQIQELIHDPHWNNWQWQLGHLIHSLDELGKSLGLSEAALASLQPVADRYPILTTPYYLSLAASADRRDPVVAQILPDQAELSDTPTSNSDPLAEERDSPVPGLVHRYPDRALLVMTSQCAVHCRHCMRKRAWDRRRDAASPLDREAALQYLRDSTGIHEVLVSGGDPLLLPLERLEQLLADLHAIPHIDLVRIGSRLPVVLPQRFTVEFCRRLSRFGPVWLATHANHPQELSAESAQAVLNCLGAGIPVVNQTVLLRGINDSADVQRALARKLLRQRIKPYYLFHGDPVAGTMHFRTGLDQALTIVDDLRRNISGLAQPTFAFDLPDGGGKIRLEPQRECEATADGIRCFRDFKGKPRPYPEPTEQA